MTAGCRKYKEWKLTLSKRWEKRKKQDAKVSVGSRCAGVDSYFSSALS
jgi:hypothetical protein